MHFRHKKTKPAYNYRYTQVLSTMEGTVKIDISNLEAIVNEVLIYCSFNTIIQPFWDIRFSFPYNCIFLSNIKM